MIRKKIAEWDAIIHFDEQEKVYTITFDGNGGPIVSDADCNEAERQFADAMQLAESLGKLAYFKEHDTFPANKYPQ